MSSLKRILIIQPMHDHVAVHVLSTLTGGFVSFERPLQSSSYSIQAWLILEHGMHVDHVIMLPRDGGRS